MDTESYRALGLDVSLSDGPPSEVNGRSNMEIIKAFDTGGDQAYHPCAEAFPGESVPRGRAHHWAAWAESTVFPDTRRDIWLHVPSGLDPAGPPPALAIFFDGRLYADPVMQFASRLFWIR